jgi:hypothetical protein
MAALIFIGPLVISCGGDGGGGGTVTGPKAVPGELTASLVTPNADDRAVLLAITGPGSISGISTTTEYVVFAQTASGKATVAVFGSLTNGVLVRFSVPDVGAVASYTATITDIVDPGNVPRQSLGGYSITVAK